MRKIGKQVMIKRMLDNKQYRKKDMRMNWFLREIK